MRILCFIISVLAIGLCDTAQAKDCEFGNSGSSHMQVSATIELIRNQFAASKYESAIRIAQTEAASLISLSGLEGSDARFALREMAIDISRNDAFPSEPRVALLRAAAISLASSGAAQIKEELQADVRMLLAGGRELWSQKDTIGWLDTLTLAIRLDRQLVDTDRRIDSRELQPLLPDPYRPYNHFDRLAILAELTRGDKLMEEFRSELVHTIYFNVMNWREDGSRELTLDRCKQLLRLIDALSDVTSCYQCPPEWRWWPVIKIGAAYKRLDMSEEAKAYVEQAIQIVRNNPNSEHRLGLYRFVLSELIHMRYDRKVILSFLNEMEELANSLDTPLAREVRNLWLKEFLERARFKR